MKKEYLKYGKAFGQNVGRKYGGVAKVVGNVVPTPPPSSSTYPNPSTTTQDRGISHDASSDTWDEIALAHYPSIVHFAAMLQDEEYQMVNHKHRLPSLRDTCILMTSEIGVEEMMKGSGGGGAKL